VPATNQAVTVSGTANLGAGATAVSNLSLNLCYQGTTGAPAISTQIEQFNGFGYAGLYLGLPAGAFMPFSMTRTFSGLAADTYTVGLCGCIDGTDAWITDWSWVNATVVQQ
jgi:hypothetical protein